MLLKTLITFVMLAVLFAPQSWGCDIIPGKAFQKSERILVLSSSDFSEPMRDIGTCSIIEQTRRNVEMGWMLPKEPAILGRTNGLSIRISECDYATNAQPLFTELGPVKFSNGLFKISPIEINRTTYWSTGWLGRLDWFGLDLSKSLIP